MRSLFPYYGGKFNQLRDILAVMGDHKDSFDVVVDVFGGSGKVLLNIPDEWRKLKVYNDLDRDLYVTFKVLQNRRKSLELSRRLRATFEHYDAFMLMRHRYFRSDVDTAFKVFYLQTYSFMGDGTTFGRRFKGHKGVPRFHIENFLYVKDWTVENMDFRLLMKKYNKPKVFFYLDPPYISSGKKYKHSFQMQDLIDLKRMMDELEGSYLLNLSFYDEGMEGVFGKPNKTIDYANPLTENGRKRWICGYWWKFPW
ncbi:MAG: DNA adenine methylase [Thermoplasmatales archaeon]|jgi:DNA adenine methylase|nr:DNA adenine methylase [Candidatus Thermoplasmatota archaeon]MCL6003354.1 DNA adenine methylase [Candidatus Thermoplasmatota archaeon]MDA8056030.1 DNA adenine methylase [Thermoplasmatales archaeon]